MWTPWPNRVCLVYENDAPRLETRSQNEVRRTNPGRVVFEGCGNFVGRYPNALQNTLNKDYDYGRLQKAVRVQY